MSITIHPADLDSAEFGALIQAHSDLMLSLSPRESCHFLALDGLRNPSVTVWEMRDGDELVGCGALQALSDTHGEVKSMHTLAAYRGRGLGRMMLDHVLSEARARGYTKISLETGSMDGFKPSRTLYASRGFGTCPPFGTYVEDPNSVFMTRAL